MKYITRPGRGFVGIVVALGTCGEIAIGCGSGDDNGSNPATDAGTHADATMDGSQSTADTGVTSDVVADTGVLSSDADAGSGDASPGPTDASLAADGDAGEASVTLSGLAFPGQLATALCDNIAACCGTAPDAASFNWQACYAAQLASGFKGSNVGASLFDGGNIAFNATQAQTCLDTIAAADCASNQITSGEQVQLYQNCFGAYAGVLPTGSACAGSIECAPGDYCSPADGGVGDAGAIGLCQPLTDVGGACGVFGENQTLGQTACSYRGAASNGRFCRNISGDAGTAQLSASAWTCQEQWPVGSECYANQDCVSMICHQVGTTSAFACATAGSWANANTCSDYVTADAGGAD